MKNYLFNHTDETSALIIQDYPYGFRLRTQIRYWIETAPKKGDRFCSQTLNPKNGRWNAPKKGTYNAITVMFSNEIGHIHCDGLGSYDNKEKVSAFINEIGGTEKLNKDQKVMYNQLLGIQPIKQDELTGKVKKDFAVKWEKDYLDEYDEVKITFDRPDGVKPREIFEALKSLNQDKLKSVFKIRHSQTWGDRPGTVRICIRGGYQLATVSEESYNEYLASDTNTVKSEIGFKEEF